MLSSSLYVRCARTVMQKRAYSLSPRLRMTDESKLPRIANPAFWSSIIPRRFKKAADAEEAAERIRVKDAAHEERRTALGFLVLGILVGSNAINLLSLRREMLNFSRETDAKLEVLREVIQKVKSGQEIDVRRILGTGDAKAEEEWEQVMRELETADMLAEGRRRRQQKREEKAAAKNAEDAAGDNQAASQSRPKFLM